MPPTTSWVPASNSIIEIDSSSSEEEPHPPPAAVVAPLEPPPVDHFDLSNVYPDMSVDGIKTLVRESVALERHYSSGGDEDSSSTSSGDDSSSDSLLAMRGGCASDNDDDPRHSSDDDDVIDLQNSSDDDNVPAEAIIVDTPTPDRDKKPSALRRTAAAADAIDLTNSPESIASPSKQVRRRDDDSILGYDQLSPPKQRSAHNRCFSDGGDGTSFPFATTPKQHKRSSSDHSVSVLMGAMKTPTSSETPYFSPFPQESLSLQHNSAHATATFAAVQPPSMADSSSDASFINPEPSVAAAAANPSTQMDVFGTDRDGLTRRREALTSAGSTGSSRHRHQRSRWKFGCRSSEAVVQQPQQPPSPPPPPQQHGGGGGGGGGGGPPPPPQQAAQQPGFINEWANANRSMAQQNPDVRSVSQVHPDEIRPLFDDLQAVDDLNNINTGNPPRNHNLPDGWSSPPQARVLYNLSFAPNTRWFTNRRLFSGDGYQLHEQSLMAIVDATADVAMAGYSDLVSSREVAVALILSTAVFSNRMPFGELN